MAADTRVPESTAPGAGAAVPDKPSLDGLEEKWAAPLGGDGTYRFDRAEAPGRARRSTRSTRRRRR